MQKVNYFRIFIYKQDNELSFQTFYSSMRKVIYVRIFIYKQDNYKISSTDTSI